MDALELAERLHEIGQAHVELARKKPKQKTIETFETQLLVKRSGRYLAVDEVVDAEPLAFDGRDADVPVGAVTRPVGQVLSGAAVRTAQPQQRHAALVQQLHLRPHRFTVVSRHLKK